MNPSTTALTLNLQLPNIATVSWAVQGDQLSRVITATLLDGSTAWNPQASYHGVMRYHKPDGTSGVYDVDEDGNPAVTWSGNVATIKIVQQALTVPGSVMMQLEFYDANSARVSAFGWINNVQPSAVTDNEFLSADYYNILTLQIAAVLGAETHPPYIDDTTHDWMVWDTTVNDYVDSGVYAIGPVGPPPTVTATGNQYANSTSGTTPPSSWSDTRPAPVQGQWSWTKTTVVFDTGTSTFYTAAYQGIDGGGNPGTATPLMDGTAAVGTSSQWAHEDHVHPSDTSKVSKAGDTVSGLLNLDGTVYIRNEADLQVDASYETPPSTSKERYMWFVDENDKSIGYLRTKIYGNTGTVETALTARKNVNGSTVQNTLQLSVGKNGAISVEFSAPAAWRNALGLGTSGALPITVAQGGTGVTQVLPSPAASSIVTAASGITISSATARVWGKVCQINIAMKNTSAVASGALLATLKDGYKPAVPTNARDVFGFSYFITMDGRIEIYSAASANVNLVVRAFYLLP